MSNADEVRARFAATAEHVAAHAAAQVERVREEVQELVVLRGDERALDSGTGAGTVALALAPLVREVVGVDLVPELLDAARRHAPPNATFVEADVENLPFESFSFDVATSRRTLHHISRPELAVAELARITRPGGIVLVEDQIASIDPLTAFEVDRFERARDPSHTRLLPDVDLRQLFEINGLVVQTVRRKRESRAVDRYLDLAGCSGGARSTAAALVPGGGDAYIADAAWYVLRRS